VNFRFFDRPMDYTGRELRSGWIKEAFGLEGNSIVSFAGSCHVSGPDLVDLEDLALGNIVAGDRMLHFLVEIFGLSLPGIVFAQRLLCSLTKELLVGVSGGKAITRHGDDLFVGSGKLSVSVATASAVSGLIHMGLNISKQGVPVEAACLEDLGLDYREVASSVVSGFAQEVQSSLQAAKKVRLVR
jgi:hypothetical protein